ncbi:MAG TPA: protein kinase [Pyrinomonadaceae bacterium]|jgi:Serine/threonine protein kinase|nr:protein kinase [Pyrinomonadaceae bacterium]
MLIQQGTRLGRYEVLSLLGKGGMGEVYLAHDTQLRRQVAIKVLPGEVTKDRNRLSRFEQEAYAASSLNHPNILTIYEFGVQDGNHFIATEYIDGESLRQHIGRSQIQLSEVLHIAEQVASALSAAHQAGIIHRDIKPENIMFRRDGIIKVLDFGLAKLADDSSHPDPEAETKAKVTEPGVVLGTASYMSPEQTRGLPLDQRSDIWSLGVVIYELVAGCLPFAGETTTDIIASIVKTEPRMLSARVDVVPAELERIVTKALRKDKEERYQVVKELALDVKSLRQHLEFETELERTGAPESFRRTTQQTKVEPTRWSVEFIAAEFQKRKSATALLLLAAFLIIAGIGYSVYSRFGSASGSQAITSIAVLPFTNTNHDLDSEYLSDGLSESLINRLSQVPGVKVIARSSSFKYKDKDIDIQEVAKALGVNSVLTGRISQRGDDLLVSAELVDARDKTQVWGEQYNKKTKDLISVQSEIASEIAEKLRPRLSSGEQQRVAKRETGNTEAYQLRLKGSFYSNKGDLESQKKAVEYFKQAIAVDPAYALAYAELSINYSNLVGSSVLEPKEYIPQAERAAQRALELDESLPEAHYALSYLRTYSWDWATSERELERTIELNPNLAMAHGGYAIYLSIMKRHGEAITEAQRARELDPLALWLNANVGYTYYFARQYDKAIEALNKSLELERNFPLVHIYLGYVHAAKGDYKEAIAAYKEAIRVGNDSPSTQIYLGAAYAKAGERDQAEAILKSLETSKSYASPVELAILYGSLGKRDEAFASLEKGYQAHDLQFPWANTDPAFDSLRSDPRFHNLMTRIGL